MVHTGVTPVVFDTIYLIRKKWIISFTSYAVQLMVDKKRITSMVLVHGWSACDYTGMDDYLIVFLLWYAFVVKLVAWLGEPWTTFCGCGIRSTVWVSCVAHVEYFLMDDIYARCSLTFSFANSLPPITLTLKFSFLSLCLINSHYWEKIKYELEKKHIGPHALCTFSFTLQIFFLMIQHTQAASRSLHLWARPWHDSSLGTHLVRTR